MGKLKHRALKWQPHSTPAMSPTAENETFLFSHSACPEDIFTKFNTTWTYHISFSDGAESAAGFLFGFVLFFNNYT